jgi:hypothetical protein
MTTFRFIIILLLGVLGSSCHAAPSATNALAGAYICDVITMSKIHLVIKPDGTYEASCEYQQPLGVRRESGVWTAKGEDLILQRRSGDCGFAIRRLRPDQEVSGRLVWISPVGSGGGGAIVYPYFYREVL